MDELVSVIIPIYNVGLILEDCVQSVLDSTYSNIEVLLIDDGSEIETASLCDSMMNRDPRVKAFHQENRGVSAARNYGLDIAIGQYITFVDADDKIEKNLIEELLNDCKKQNADIAIGGIREWRSNKNYKENFCTNKIEILYGDAILKTFFATNNIGPSVWGKIFKKSAIKTVRFKRDRKIAEDLFFIYEILKKANTVVLHGEAFYNYVKRNESVMENNEDAEKFFDTYYLVKEIYEDETIDSVYDEYKLIYYIRNELFFFRIIYGKKLQNCLKKEIKILRNEFLNSIKNKIVVIPIKLKLELFIFKYILPIFKLFRITGGV